MIFHNFCLFWSALTLLGTVNGQVFDVFGSTDDAGITEFSLEMDEVFLTDLENAPVSTHHMRPGIFYVIQKKTEFILKFLKEKIKSIVQDNSFCTKE